MIYGNPFKFAILVDTVEAWCEDESFIEGILYFCINQKLFPSNNEIISITLNSGVGLYDYAKPPFVWKNPPQNPVLFDMDKHDAFYQLMMNIWPLHIDEDYEEDYDFEEDYSYFISPDQLFRLGMFCFLVGKGDLTRIILGYKRDTTKNHISSYDIEEIVMKQSEVYEIFYRALSDYNCLPKDE